MKRQLTEWEKSLASYSFDRRFVSMTYNELKNLNIKKITHLISRYRTKQSFPKNIKQLGNTVKVLNIREMKRKMILRFYFTPVRNAINRNRNNNVSINTVKREPYALVAGV